MPGDPLRLLILGGTSEAAALALRLENDGRLHVITSLAGRTRGPALLAGEVRIGGFGGSSGLARYLSEEAIDLVVDATHPFAQVISANASEACGTCEVPRLVLRRPPWRTRPGDRWTDVADCQAAARALPNLGRRAFLAIGRQELSAFAHLSQIWFLVRLIDPVEPPAPLVRCQVVYGRGPFGEEDESTLLGEHRIDVVVSKNSGGAATYGKIAAARRLDLPTVMILRPARPEGALARTLAQAIEWIDAQFF